MPNPNTTRAADAIDLLLRHNWPRARRCTYCPNAEFDRLGSNDFLDATLYARVLHDLGSIGYDGELVLVGTNEIFMHERNLDYIAAARQQLPSCRIKLFSNGDYLDREQVEKLVALGVDTLVVTLHPAAGKPYDEAELRVRAAGSPSALA